MAVPLIFLGLDSPHLNLAKYTAHIERGEGLFGGQETKAKDHYEQQIG